QSALKQLYARAMQPFVKQTVAEARRSLSTLRKQMVEAGLGEEGATDIVLGIYELHTEGDAAGGWRVQLRGSDGELTGAFYLIQEDGAPKLLCGTGSLPTLGAEALRRVERKQLDAARRRLDWARDEIAPTSAVDPLAGAPFARLWQSGGDAG